MEAKNTTSPKYGFWGSPNLEKSLLYIVIAILIIALLASSLKKLLIHARIPEESRDSYDTVINTHWTEANTQKFDTVSGELTTVADLDLPGEFLLLVFFHPECEFCAMEAPLWHQLGNNVWRNDIDIVGVAARTNEEALKSFLQEFQLHFPILIDSDGLLYEQMKVEILPTKVLLSEDFLVMQRWQGLSKRQLPDEELGSLFTILGIPPSVLPDFP